MAETPGRGERQPAPPVVVHVEEEAATAVQQPLPPRPLPQPPPPMPPPVPSMSEILGDTVPAIPSFQPFSFLPTAPLSASDLDVITVFHATWMQDPQVFTPPGSTTQSRLALVRLAQSDAQRVKPLMERQYTLACQGMEGTHGGEARAVAVNLEWVNKLLEVQV